MLVIIWWSSQQSPEQHALPWFGDQLILFGLNYWHHQLSVTINVIIIVNSKLKVWRPWTLSSSQDLIGRLSKWAFLVIVTTNTNSIIITNIVPPARGTGPFPPSGISGLLLLLLSSLSPYFYHHHHHYHNNIPYHDTNPPPEPFDQPGSSHHENLAPLKHLGRLRASSSTTISSSSTYTFSFASSSLSSPSLSSSQQQNHCKIVTIINFLTKGSYSSTNHNVMSFSIPDAPLVNPICSPAFSE